MVEATDTRYSALCELLTLPDPDDLPPRTHRYCCTGDPTRQERLKQELAAVYRARRLLSAYDHAGPRRLVGRAFATMRD
jgi:hypothetical protein